MMLTFGRSRGRNGKAQMTWLKDLVLRIFVQHDRGELLSLGLSSTTPSDRTSEARSNWNRMTQPCPPIPHPANVPGDFYVEYNCCTMCGVPFVEAPELFGTHTDPAGYEHCFVKRQPATLKELDHMFGAIACAELQCIRYSGRDQHILNHLIRIGERSICDYPREDL